MVATSEVSVSLTIDNTRALDAIRAEIREFAEVTMEENQAIVCLVGENIRTLPRGCGGAGLHGADFIGVDGINIRMVSQGASLLNISLVVAADGPGVRAVESLHREFFG